MKEYETMEELKNDLFDNENVYEVRRNYRSYYDDDDCDFVYWDEEKKVFTTAGWTTRCAAPSFSHFVKKNIKQAIGEGLIDTAALKNAIIDGLDTDTFVWYYRKHQEVGLDYLVPCKVTGGRKFKGEGILICFDEKEVNIGWGRHTSYKVATILSKEGTIETATAGYVEIDESVYDEKEANIKTVLHGMDEADFLSKWLRDGLSGYITSNLIFPLGDEKYKEIYLAKKKEMDDERKAKHNQWLAEKKVGLLEWCKVTFAGKSEEEIQRICDRIMVKKYGSVA